MAGAGSSFGVVTTFYFQTHEAPELGVTFGFNLPSSLTTSAAAKTNTILAIQSYTQTAPNELTLGLYMESGVFSLSGLYWGSVSDFNIVIAPLLASLPGSSLTNVITVDWVESLQHLAGSGPVQQPLSGYDLHDNLVSFLSSFPFSRECCMLIRSSEKIVCKELGYHCIRATHFRKPPSLL